MINPDIILPFDGNHADIPSGFTRETSLDDKFPKAWGAENPNTTGGSSTHTHTSPSHTHSLNSHNHSGTSGNSTDNTDSERPSGTTLAQDNHDHSYTTSSTVSGGSTNGSSVTYGARSNNPPYYNVIFIKSENYNLIPDDTMVLKEGTSRNGLSFHSASAGKYLKGAGTGNDAGGTGGSTTNVHSINHSHTTNSHTHSSSNTSGANDYGGGYSSGVSGSVTASHVHSMTVGSGTQGISSYSGSLTTLETVEPAYKTLNAFKTDSGDSVLPQVGDIALFLGDTSDLPVGWNLCDGNNGTPDMRNKFLKLNSSAGASSTGGSNTHTHSAQSHSHSASGSHTHNVSFSTVSANADREGSGTTHVFSGGDHSHTAVTSGSKTASYASANTTAESSNNEPAYRTVAYIQYEYSSMGGASFFMNLL